MGNIALIIDDNSLNLDSLAALLKREGMEPVGITRLNDTFSTLEKIGDVRVVFLDLEFPNGDGIAFVDRLLNDERLEGVPIVAYSVHISELTEVRDAGFHGFIGKPLNPSQFPEQLRRILNGESVWEVGQ